jgi:hypothetical protein
MPRFAGAHDMTWKPSGRECLRASIQTEKRVSNPIQCSG